MRCLVPCPRTLTKNWIPLPPASIYFTNFPNLITDYVSKPWHINSNTLLLFKIVFLHFSYIFHSIHHLYAQLNLGLIPVLKLWRRYMLRFLKTLTQLLLLILSVSYPNLLHFFQRNPNFFKELSGIFISDLDLVDLYIPFFVLTEFLEHELLFSLFYNNRF